MLDKFKQMIGRDKTKQEQPEDQASQGAGKKKRKKKSSTPPLQPGEKMHSIVFLDGEVIEVAGRTFKIAAGRAIYRRVCDGCSKHVELCVDERKSRFESMRQRKKHRHIGFAE